MKLYHSPTSPYVRKVMVLLHLTAQLDAVELIPGSGTPVDPNQQTCAVNPLGKIPCLVTDEGLALYDSRVISRYLNARAGAGFYPQGEALWPVLALESLAEGILDAAILVVYEMRLRPAELQYQPWMQAQMSKVHRALGVLEGQARTFGPQPDAAQIAVGCALGYLDLRFPEPDWRVGRPALTEWYAGFSALPAMQATVPV